MPQNISGAPVATHSNGRSAPVQVDAYADRLMDDLFEDVEDLLSGSVPPPEPVRAQPQKPSAIVMPPALSPIVTRSKATLPNLPQWNSALPEVDELIASKPPKLQSNRFQKFLAIAFGLTALTAASVWLVQRGTVQRLFAMAAQEPPAISTSTPVKALSADTTPQFVRYMQRSLENIDRKAATKPASVIPFKNALPPIPVTGDSAKTPVVINVPSVSSPLPVTPAVSKTPQELNQVLARLTSALERLSINPASVRTTPSASLPVAVQSSVIEPQRLLRGIAIATDPTQSAILFEMNGVTQRYYIGESIGSSGWSVVDISNNYVTIRRNGEVRSISIGQKL